MSIFEHVHVHNTSTLTVHDVDILWFNTHRVERAKPLESHHWTPQAQTLSPSLHSDGDVDTAALSPPRDPVVLGPIVPGG